MNESPEAVKVYFDGAVALKKPRVMPWHWVAYYAYNLARKPKVWRMKREQNRIYRSVQHALVDEVLPQLYQVRLVCAPCRNAYYCLKSQVFISMIDMILKNMRCEDHPHVYDEFRLRHCHDFLRNEELAAKINGFQK